MNNTLKIKITKVFSNAIWYFNNVGEEFEVEDNLSEFAYAVKSDMDNLRKAAKENKQGSLNNVRMILKQDCEIL